MRTVRATFHPGAVRVRADEATAGSGTSGAVPCSSDGIGSGLNPVVSPFVFELFGIAIGSNRPCGFQDCCFDVAAAADTRDVRSAGQTDGAESPVSVSPFSRRESRIGIRTAS